MTREGEGAQDRRKAGEGGWLGELGEVAKDPAKVGVGERDLRVSTSGALGRE